jgi:hypothetical protein
VNADRAEAGVFAQFQDDPRLPHRAAPAKGKAGRAVQ